MFAELTLVFDLPFQNPFELSLSVLMPFCHRALVSVGHIFSPNEREAASLVGAGTPLELIARLSELGAEVHFH